MLHPPSRVYSSLLGLGHCRWCTTSLKGAAHVSPPPPPPFHRDDIAPGKRSCAELLTLSYFSFRIGTMTSSVPWKFHLPSYAPTSVPVLRVPIKRGSQLSISTEHSRVLKLLGSSVSAPGKPLLCQDHEALCDCPLSPRASGGLLLSSALSTK